MNKLDSLHNKAEDFVKESIKALKDTFNGEKFELDHLKLKVTDHEDFSTACSQANELGKLLVELPHAGRRIAIYKLNEPFTASEFTLEKIVIAEPKPGEKLAGRYWDHLSFFVPEFDNFIEKYTAENVKFHEFRAIGTARFTNVTMGNVTLQFRNKKFGEDSINEQNTYVNVSNLINQVNEEKEAKLKILADFQNYKKRVERTQSENTSMANKALINNVLEAIDDFTRALDHSQNGGKDYNALYSGCEMILSKMQQLTTEQGLKPIEIKVGDKFDPKIMDALASVPVNDPAQNGTVLHIEQKGYTLSGSDQIFRHAKVIIGKHS